MTLRGSDGRTLCLSCLKYRGEHKIGEICAPGRKPRPWESLQGPRVRPARCFQVQWAGRPFFVRRPRRSALACCAVPCCGRICCWLHQKRGGCRTLPALWRRRAVLSGDLEQKASAGCGTGEGAWEFWQRAWEFWQRAWGIWQNAWGKCKISAQKCASAVHLVLFFLTKHEDYLTKSGIFLSNHDIFLS